MPDDLVLDAPSQQQWGVFLNGEAVVVSDSQVSFEFKQDFPISTYPVEDGGFQSYDKVQLPAQIRCRFSAGGSIDNRQQFLQSISANMNTTDLYDLVTPEQVYIGYNFSHQDFARDASRAGLIVVDLWFIEIRETATANFPNTKQPAEAGQQSSGFVSPQVPNALVNNQWQAAGGVT